MIAVKYMYIQILKQTMNVCDELKKLDNAPMQCPIESGKKEWIYEYDLPNEIPPVSFLMDSS